MIKQVAKSCLLSLGAAVLTQFALNALGSTYLKYFLTQNVVNLQIALLAVNSATMGIVLTKIRDLVEKFGHGDVFHATRNQMLLSIKEQVGLIFASIAILSSQDVSRPIFPANDFAFSTALIAVFFYAMMILYDTAKSVLLVVDFGPKS
jgi:hypothetical protein